MSDPFVDYLGNEILDALEAFDRDTDLSAAKELRWCDSIVHRLSSHENRYGLRNDERNVSYPGHKQRFDLRLWFASGQEVILEAKGAWKTYWLKYQPQPQPQKFYNYLFYPLAGYRTKHNSSAKALEKLATLTPRTASHIGLVIMGSAWPEHDIAAAFDRFAEVTQIDREPWKVQRRCWNNRHAPSYAFDVRVFLCPNEEAASWWARIRDLY